MFFLCRYPCPLTPLTVAGLAKFRFQALLRLYNEPTRGGAEIFPEGLKQNVMPDLYAFTTVANVAYSDSDRTSQEGYPPKP